MGYRYDDIPHDMKHLPPEEDCMLPEFRIRNGAILRIAFKCRYVLHNHDHPMYVYPHIAGDVALLRRENHNPYDKLEYATFPLEYSPIDLLSVEEDYDPNAQVVFEEDDGHIEVISAYIDPEETSIIRISMSVQYPEFIGEPIRKHFTVFVRSNSGDRIDAVCHGVVMVLPGKPYDFTEPQSEEPTVEG